MKKVGIIGGAGPLASALLYETIVQELYQQVGKMPEIFLINFPFTRGLSVKEGKGNEETIKGELRYCVNALAQNRVEVGILACNTLHLYLRQLPEVAALPTFLSLPNLVMKEAKEKAHHRLLILGTQNTCQSNLYHHSNMEMLYPSKEHQMLMNEIIDRLLEGKIRQEDSCLVSKMIEQLSTCLPFDGVVLGCTDLPVLHHRFPILSNKPLYDSIKIPAKILRTLL